MRYFLLIFLVCVGMTVAIAGRRGSLSRRPPIELFPDMNRQPKLRPQSPDDFFADGRSSRLPIPGTIAREDIHYADLAVNTGQIPGTTNFIDTIPVPVTEELMARGEQRFNINCSPCHGRQADGNGVVKKLGLATVANLHDKRIVELKDGEIFHTITYGKNTMMPYGANVTVEDRWAIIAYVRALQLSQLGLVDDVPESMRGALKK
jgi:mono/diheme cytochrome c family protein